MSAEVDGACLSRLPGVSSSDAQVDSLENDQYHHEYMPVAPIGDLDRPVVPPVSTVPATSAKVSPGASSSSLHRVADKLKEKLSRQMESEDAATGQNSDAAMSNATQSPLTKDLTPLGPQGAQKTTSSSEARSQYHSILKLSSPSSKSFGAPSNFSSSQNQHYDFSSGPAARFFGHHPSDIYAPTVADTLDMLRGMMKGGGDAKKDAAGYSSSSSHSIRQSMSGGKQQQQQQLMDYCDYDDRMMFADSKYVFGNNSEDDAESFQSETMPESGEGLSGDDFSDAEEMNRTSPAAAAAYSRSSSVSSERRRPLKEEEDDNDEEDDEEGDEDGARLRSNGADGSICSEDSFEDKMEAKKARVENIISNMRPSPNSKTTPSSRQATVTEVAATLCDDGGDHRQNGVAVGGTAAGGGGYGQVTEVRRPKRKQYIPQQHEAREDEMDETPPVKLRKVEKEVIQQELQQMHEQLAEMQQKCLQLLDHDDQQQPTAAAAAADRPSALQDFVEGGGGGEDRCRNPSKLLNSSSSASDLNRNDIQKLETLIPHADGKHLVERVNKQFDDLQSIDSNKVTSLKHLAKLLKAEITSSVGALVDSIVKNFMAKHVELQKESAREPAQMKESSKKNVFDQVLQPLPPQPPRDPTGVGIFKQQREEPTFLTASKPPLQPALEASQPLVMSRPPCLPPTLLPPHLQLPVHPPFSEQNSLSQSVKQQQRELAEKYIRPYFDLHGKTAFEIPQAHLPLFAPHAFYPPPPMHAKFQPLFVKEPEQTEALPLVVSTPKKKRTKVTDTRLSPRAARAMLQESLGQNPHHHHHHHHQQQQQQQDHHSHQQQARAGDRKPFPHHHHHYPTMGGLHEAFPHPSMLSIGLPTSVAIHNPSLQHSDLLQAMYSSQQQQQVMGHRDGQGGALLGGPPNGPCKRPSSNSSDLANSPNSLLKCDSDAYDQMMSDSMMSYDGHGLISFHY